MKRLTRFLRNVFWYWIVSLVSVAFFSLAPLGLLEKLIGLALLDAVLVIVISALREKLRF